MADAKGAKGVSSGTSAGPLPKTVDPEATEYQVRRLQELSANFAEQAREEVKNTFDGDPREVINRPVVVAPRLLRDAILDYVSRFLFDSHANDDSRKQAIATHILHHDALRHEYAYKAEVFRKLAKHSKERTEAVDTLLVDICMDPDAMKALPENIRKRVDFLAGDEALKLIHDQLVGTTETDDDIKDRLFSGLTDRNHTEEKVFSALKTVVRQFDNTLIDVNVSRITHEPILKVELVLAKAGQIDNVVIYDALNHVIPKGVTLEIHTKW